MAGVVAGTGVSSSAAKRRKIRGGHLVLVLGGRARVEVLEAAAHRSNQLAVVPLVRVGLHGFFPPLRLASAADSTSAVPALPARPAASSATRVQQDGVVQDGVIYVTYAPKDAKRRLKCQES